MRTIKLTLAYDGRIYAGWQRQANQLTIQGELERALAEIVGAPVTTVGSGRTDAGVHALGQVASFDVESRLTAAVFQRALNARLPDDIVVIGAAEAPPGFHAIRDARRKRYRYLIHDAAVRDVFGRDYSWHHAVRLDDAAMRAASAALMGTHDFSSFETAGSERETSVRTVFDLAVRRPPCGAGNRLEIEVEADGFLYKMVRTIVGSLVEIGRGARTVDWLAGALAARDRRAAGPTAPARGLYLLWVDYGELTGLERPEAVC